MRGAALVAAASQLALLLYVLPPDRVLGELARRREASAPSPLRMEATLSGEAWPARARYELYPGRGLRVADGEGSRWLVQDGHVTGPASEGSASALWVSAPELLALRGRAEISGWLERAGVDLQSSVLARCGDADCFRLGGRDQPGQLWVDKDQFEVRRFRSPEGWSLEFEDYRDWDGLRFPSRIRVELAAATLGVIQIERIDRAPELSSADFSPRWVQSKDR
jgi:hypothetical protein